MWDFICTRLTLTYVQGGSGSASNIKFMNIEMQSVANPIIIDQNYCDQDKPCKPQVTFQNPIIIIIKKIKKKRQFMKLNFCIPICKLIIITFFIFFNQIDRALQSRWKMCCIRTSKEQVPRTLPSILIAARALHVKGLCCRMSILKRTEEEKCPKPYATMFNSIALLDLLHHYALNINRSFIKSTL